MYDNWITYDDIHSLPVPPGLPDHLLPITQKLRLGCRLVAERCIYQGSHVGMLLQFNIFACGWIVVVKLKLIAHLELICWHPPKRALLNISLIVWLEGLKVSSFFLFDTSLKRDEPHMARREALNAEMHINALYALFLLLLLWAV